MGDGNRDTRKRFGRRGRDRNEKRVENRGEDRGENRGENRGEPAPKAPELPPVACAICAKQIFDLSSALADRESGQPVHFDCALAKVVERERLDPNERIAYVGRGAFAVVEYRDKSMTAFTIKRKIQWEQEGAKFDWRRDIQQRVGT